MSVILLPDPKTNGHTLLRFIIAQVQDDFYGNVGTYMAGPIRKRIVDNKNRVLSLHPKLGTDYIGMYHEPKLGS